MNITEAYLQGYMAKEAADEVTPDKEWADFNPDKHTYVNLGDVDPRASNFRWSQAYKNKLPFEDIIRDPLVRLREYQNYSKKINQQANPFIEKMLLDYDIHRYEKTPADAFKAMRKSRWQPTILKKLKELINKGIITAQNRPVRTNNLT